VLNLTTVTAVLLVGQRSLSLVPVVSLLSWVQVVNYSIYFGILWWIVVRGTAAASATDPRAGVDPAGGD
jgi:hypothetical protein